jgi:hypothetical protein
MCGIQRQFDPRARRCLSAFRAGDDLTGERRARRDAGDAGER